MTALLWLQETAVVWQLQEMIEEMCKHVEKPLVFPLSNPTSQAEITAENAYKYSKGKCIFAGGEHPDKQLVTLTPCTCTAARGRCYLGSSYFPDVFKTQFGSVCHLKGSVTALSGCCLQDGPGV